MKKVSSALAERKIEALLVSDPANVRYLTGFTGSNGLLLLVRGEGLFFTDPRYEIQASQEVSCAVRVVRGPLLPAVAKAAKRRGLRRLAVEKHAIRYDEFEVLAKVLPLGGVNGLVEEFRMVKSADEIARIRAAVATGSEAFERSVRAVKPGMRELDFAAELDHRMRRGGAERPAFETIVAAGPHGALPHARPGPNRMAAGQLVLVDMGAQRAGYAGDMTRMIHLGPVRKQTRDRYRAVLEAQLAGIDAIRPGVSGARVDRAVRAVLERHGLGEAFTHSTGHGLGLEIHENPRLGKTGKTKLAAGMTVTVEPGIYIEGWGGIRIEDTVLVTGQGSEVLTPTSKELREV